MEVLKDLKGSRQTYEEALTKTSSPKKQLEINLIILYTLFKEDNIE
jgi:hypothetical protein